MRDAREYFKDRPRRRELPLGANRQKPQPQEVEPEIVPEQTTEVEVAEVSSFSNGEFDMPIIIDGDTFKVLAPQLSRSMGHREAYDMMRNVPEDEKGSDLVQTRGGIQRVGYVTEAGFYRVIGQRQTGRIPDEVIRDKVMRFQRWVFSEVLPQINRTNTYVPAQQDGITVPRRPDRGGRSDLRPPTEGQGEACASTAGRGHVGRTGRSLPPKSFAYWLEKRACCRSICYWVSGD